MQRVLYVLLVMSFSLFLFCSDDGDGNGTGPSTDPGVSDDFSSFLIQKHYVSAQVPSQVTLMFQVTNLSRKLGADFLTADRFQVTEKDERLSNESVNLYALKRDDMLYTGRTVLMLDVNQGTDMAAVKQFATEFVNNMDPQQEVSLFTFAEEINQVSDYTNDVGSLTQAINDLTEGSAGSDLYGGIMNSIRGISDFYKPGEVIQNTFVVVTDGEDTQATFAPEYVQNAVIGRRVYIVGIGNQVNRDNLDTIGGELFYEIPATENISEQVLELQTNIADYFDSFYRVTYTTSVRSGENNKVRLSITQNTNTGLTSYIEDIFNATILVDVADGLYINWSYANPQGAELIYVMTNKSREITVQTMGGQALPQYEFEVMDTNVATVEEIGSGLARVQAHGATGDSTKLIARDPANAVADTATIKIVDYLMGVVLFEKWNELTGSGSGVAALTNDPRYPNNPNEVDELTEWQIPTDEGDNYGTRIRGYLHPTTTGEYTFWIASDDQSQLYLSTDATEDNKRVVCEVTGWTSSREWDKEAGQQSDPIQLEAGKVYYIETLHREGTGGDNCAVAWAQGDGSPTVLSGDVLSKYLGN